MILWRHRIQHTLQSVWWQKSVFIDMKNLHFILSWFKEQTGTKPRVTKNKWTDFNPLPMLACWYNLISHMNYPSVWSKNFENWLVLLDIWFTCITSHSVHGDTHTQQRQNWKVYEWHMWVKSQDLTNSYWMIEYYNSSAGLSAKQQN